MDGKEIASNIDLLMQKIESIEILAKPSESGRYEEITFSSSNDLLWVKFNQGNGESWIGKFDFDIRNDIKKAEVIHSGRNALIISSENLILVNCVTREICAQVDDCRDALWLKDSDIIIATNGTSISIIESSNLNEIWNSKVISFPYISFEGHNNEIVFGELYNDFDEPVKFELNTRNRIITSKTKVIIPLDEQHSIRIKNRNKIIHKISLFAIFVLCILIVWRIIN